MPPLHGDQFSISLPFNHLARVLEFFSVHGGGIRVRLGGGGRVDVFVGNRGGGLRGGGGGVGCLLKAGVAKYLFWGRHSHQDQK